MLQATDLGAFGWQTTVTDRIDDPPTDDKAARLGMYEDLPVCLVAGEPFVEYGVGRSTVRFATGSVQQPATGPITRSSRTGLFRRDPRLTT
jgi:hypothetical protein